MSVAEEIKQAEKVARYEGMTQGIAYSVALFLNCWGEHPWIDEIWRAAGMTIEECSKIVDEYDMGILEEHREYLEGIENKKNR